MFASTFVSELNCCEISCDRGLPRITLEGCVQAARTRALFPISSGANSTLREKATLILFTQFI